MATSVNKSDWWMALVTFERRDSTHSDLLPDDAQGAVGWMACRSAVGDTVRDLIERSLKEVALRLVEISDPYCVQSIEEITEVDAHLAENVTALEPGKSVVWGTIHLYRADGEA